MRRNVGILLAACALTGWSACGAAGPLEWHDVKDLFLEGRPFPDAATYGRLPARFRGVIRNPKTRHLADNSAGLCARFRTDANRITFRWTLLEKDISWVNMAGIVKSGFDVYVRKDGGWQYAATLEPWAGLGVVTTNFTATVDVVPGLTYQVNFPTYNSVSVCSAGIARGCRFSPPEPRASGVTRPVVFYGTSITQGCAASRPGLAYVARIGRDLDVPVVNLGFSGGGQTHAQALPALLEIDASCYVLDCLTNMGVEQVRKGFEPFVRALWKGRPNVPVVCLQSPTQKRMDERDRLAAEAVTRLAKEGMKVTLVRREVLTTPDGEGTIDGTHPNDIGMRRIAVACGDAVRKALAL